MKALMQYNEDEIEDFMNGSGVEEMPQFSDDFEARLQESMRKAKPSAFKDKPEKKKHGKILSFFAVLKSPQSCSNYYDYCCLHRGNCQCRCCEDTSEEVLERCSGEVCTSICGGRGNY